MLKDKDKDKRDNRSNSSHWPDNDLCNEKKLERLEKYNNFTPLKVPMAEILANTKAYKLDLLDDTIPT